MGLVRLHLLPVWFGRCILSSIEEFGISITLVVAVLRKLAALISIVRSRWDARSCNFQLNNIIIQQHPVPVSATGPSSAGVHTIIVAIASMHTEYKCSGLALVKRSVRAGFIRIR